MATLARRVLPILRRSPRRQLSAVPLEAAAAFPSLVVSATGVSARGPFAEQQAAFLTPDASAVAELDKDLSRTATGVVAHYYMDAELQGTLMALRWPHVAVADSLAMGDAAVKMAMEGAKNIICLGVDFMSESVRAALDASGFPAVPVYRASQRTIGCSLASAAERSEYEAFLRKGAETPRSLHVVYINTSLITKARSQSIIPTITCTSSNVLQTILQAYAQVPDLTVWYGPDTYMGDNLHAMFERIAALPDEEIRRLHPSHNRETVRSLLKRFHFFKQGNCVVHHMFGHEVTGRVKRDYGDAFLTAHLEVPGEMFALAMEAQQRGRGVVGSTSNILNFIVDKARETLVTTVGGPAHRLQFVLGTESGMITSIVRKVQAALQAAGSGSSGGGGGVEVEIVFPVASEAVTATGESAEGGGLALVPGVSGGEGCSTAGGCATCPFMKMNDLDALADLVAGLDRSGTVPPKLKGFLPTRRAFEVAGQDKTALGVVPILHMREFMRGGKLGAELEEDVLTRCG